VVTFNFSLPSILREYYFNSRNVYEPTTEKCHLAKIILMRSVHEQIPILIDVMHTTNILIHITQELGQKGLGNTSSMQMK
jgi:hypothetical protein